MVASEISAMPVREAGSSRKRRYALGSWYGIALPLLEGIN
jgi:hypothetical protein